MVAMYPMGPIADGGALNITVMSYMGTVYFGLMACRELVPQLDDIAHYLNEALEQLLKASGAAAAPSTPPTPAAVTSRPAAKSRPKAVTATSKAVRPKAPARRPTKA
jgi:hypothetical protein